eukprot:TRINITY_DN11860_c1_g1_i2.p1 TRINITY_DN11860_c1_g1~~TRINITY_DN11860_c1_g1_i2.p1  ORF type:complete len:1227 (-),score=225.45 TRINITY_DN11860_c1_g1_i2:294-3974(-)
MVTPGLRLLQVLFTVCWLPADARGGRADSTPVPLPLDLGLPLTEDFFENSYERRWAYLPATSEAAKNALRKLWGLEKVLRHAELHGYSAWDKGFPHPDADPDGSGSGGAGAATRALQSNLSIVQNHIHRHHAELAVYMRNASLFFGVPGGLNAYTTPPDMVGFAYHYDPSDAFILQVHGKKRWELCTRVPTNPSTFNDPTANQFMPDHPDVQTCEQVLLQEGDVIYLPIGQVHRARASEGVSVHITMSLNRMFLSSSAMLLNVAEQINPSKVSGFTQKPFINWVHKAVADPNRSLHELEDVPAALKCWGGGKQLKKRRRCSVRRGFLDPRIRGRVEPGEPVPEVADETLNAFVDDIQNVIEKLLEHPSAKNEQLLLNVHVKGKSEAVPGKLVPSQVLDGIKGLLGPRPAKRTILAYRQFLISQLNQLDETISELSDVELDILEAGGTPELDDTIKGLVAQLEDFGGAAAAQRESEVAGEKNADVAQQPGGERQRPLKRSQKPSTSTSTTTDPSGLILKYVSSSGSLHSASPGDYPEEVLSKWAGQEPVVGASRQDDSGVVESEAASETCSIADSSETCITPAQRSQEEPDDDLTEGAGAAAEAFGESRFADCCGSSSAKEQVACANRTAPYQTASSKVDGDRVLIVTYATAHVHSFARYALAINANWAKRHQHSFVIDTRKRAQDGVDAKNAKVLVKKHWVAHPDVAEKWALWIGADAAIVDFEKKGDVLRRLIGQHAADPNVQIIITRDPHGRAGNSMSLFNADVILMRRTQWTTDFLQRWWDDPRMKEGRTDQEVLELLYTEDVMGAASAFVLLPPLTFNSDTLSIVAGPPATQPVVHLGGHTDEVRAVLFRKALEKVCMESSGIDRNANYLQDVYLDALWGEVTKPSDGLSSGHMHTSTITGTYHRLAWHLEQKDRRSEAVRVQKAALRVASQKFGKNSRDTLQAMTALGLSLRASGKLAEAEPLHRKAYSQFVEMSGPAHRDTLACAQNLALVLEEQSKFQEAEALYRESRKGLLKAVGPDTPSALSSAFNLAALLFNPQRGPPSSQKAIQEAEQLHRVALQGRIRAFGEDSLEAVESMEALGQLLMLAKQQATEAQPLLQKALQIRTKRNMPTDRAGVQTVGNLAQVMRMLQKKAEAVAYAHTAYKICRDTPELGGPEGPNTLAAASNLASLLHDNGQIEEARHYHRMAVRGLQNALGPDHPNTANARQNYNYFLKKEGHG